MMYGSIFPGTDLLPQQQGMGDIYICTTKWTLRPPKRTAFFIFIVSVIPIVHIILSCIGTEAGILLPQGLRINSDENIKQAME